MTIPTYIAYVDSLNDENCGQNIIITISLTLSYDQALVHGIEQF